MTYNKQSSVNQLIAEIQRRVAIIQSEPQTMARELMIDNLSVDLEQYEAMHKEEIIQTHFNAQEFNAMMLHSAEEYYKSVFQNIVKNTEITNEQQ